MFRRGHLGTPIDLAPVLLSGILCSTDHFLVNNMAIITAELMQHAILIEFKFKFSLSCWDRRQTVNLVSAGGLVEQSNAAKNKPC